MKTRLRWDWRERQGGFLVLIEILVVVVIIAMLAGYFLTGGGGLGGGRSGGKNAKGEATTVPGKAIEDAESTVCRNNLSQLRTAIATYMATNGSNPPDLETLQAQVPLTCPVGGEAYQYEASTGKVTCPHPGHTSY
jgi:type II secretory pathway pseudopilin PulG